MDYPFIRGERRYLTVYVKPLSKCIAIFFWKTICQIISFKTQNKANHHFSFLYSFCLFLPTMVQKCTEIVRKSMLGSSLDSICMCSLAEFKVNLGWKNQKNPNTLMESQYTMGKNMNFPFDGSNEVLNMCSFKGHTSGVWQISYTGNSRQIIIVTIALMSILLCSCNGKHIDWNTDGKSSQAGFTFCFITFFRGGLGIHFFHWCFQRYSTSPFIKERRNAESIFLQMNANVVVIQMGN